MKRLLSTIHAEYSGAFSARSTSFRRLSVLSNPLLITWGGSWAARSMPALPRAPATASTAITAAIRFSLGLIDVPPHLLLGTYYALVHIRLTALGIPPFLDFSRVAGLSSAGIHPARTCPPPRGSCRWPSAPADTRPPCGRRGRPRTS